MPAVTGDDGVEDLDDILIFSLTDLDNDENGDVENNNPFDGDGDGIRPKNENSFKPRMTLKERRRSLLSANGLGVPSALSLNVGLWQENNIIAQSPPPSSSSYSGMSPIGRWKKAVRMIHTMKDPWADFHLEELPVETATRHRYNALKRQWVVDVVSVKMEKEPFNHGAMRTCYRLKKLSNWQAGNWTQQAHNYVAKAYMEKVSREVYFEDVRLQMDAKLWGEEYNRHRPPKKVDIFQMSILEFNDRSSVCRLFHLEHFIDGHYTKYNSNSGFVEESLRLTPQAFSHFTFERSSHKMIVIDIQGVGDLWTDPQIHTSDGKGYGDGNLGTRGMALFFHSHICNCICDSFGLSRFDLAPSEQKGQTEFIKLQKDAMTRVRGIEEVCLSASPTDNFDFSEFFSRRSRTVSTTSAFSDDFDNGYSTSHRSVGTDEEPMSIDTTTSSLSPSFKRHRQFLSESDDSASATVTEEEERMRFHMNAKMLARPSSVAFEMDLRGIQNAHRLSDSVLGQIHHDLAMYHEIGRFSGQNEPYDVESTMYHEQQAAELGVKDAIVTLAFIFLGIPHDILTTLTVEDTTENRDQGIEYMLMAAHAGDRAAMLHMAKAFETGNGLACETSKSYKDAVDWYEKAANMTHEDDCGEFDATMDDPVYQIKAAMAEMYLVGGYGLQKDPSFAGDLFTEAAEGATAAMKGRIANKYYALAEEAWAQVEEG